MEQKEASLAKQNPESTTGVAEVVTTWERERRERQSQLSAVRLKGEAALRRLLPVAQRDTGQSGVVARFLLNLYNGDRFPFDLTDLRRLDYALFDDCMAVLRMDFQLIKEVHRYFDNGGAIWEAMAERFGFKDYAYERWR